MDQELKELIDQVKANTASIQELTETVKADKTLKIKFAPLEYKLDDASVRAMNRWLQERRPKKPQTNNQNKTIPNNKRAS